MLSSVDSVTTTGTRHLVFFISIIVLLPAERMQFSVHVNIKSISKVFLEISKNYLNILKAQLFLNFLNEAVNQLLGQDLSLLNLLSPWRFLVH